MIEVRQHFINGQRVDGTSGRFGNIFDPALGTVTARVPLVDADEIGRAVAAARQAFPKWAALTPLRRARVMSRFKSLLEENTAELAAMITSEHGKVHQDAVGEVTRGIEVVEFACGGLVQGMEKAEPGILAVAEGARGRPRLPESSGCVRARSGRHRGFVHERMIPPRAFSEQAL